MPCCEHGPHCANFACFVTRQAVCLPQPGQQQSMLSHGLIHNPPANPEFPANSNNTTSYQQQGPLPFHAQSQERPSSYAQPRESPPSYDQSLQPPPFPGHQFTQPPIYSYSQPLVIPQPSNPPCNAICVWHSPNSYMQYTPGRPEQSQPVPYQQEPPRASVQMPSMINLASITPVPISGPPCPVPSGRYLSGSQHPLSTTANHPYYSQRQTDGGTWYIPRKNPGTAHPRMRGGGGGDWDSRDEPNENSTNEELAASPTPRRYIQHRRRATQQRRLPPGEAAFDTAARRNLEDEDSDNSPPEEIFPGSQGLRPAPGHLRSGYSLPDDNQPLSPISARTRYSGALPMQQRRRRHLHRANDRPIHASVEDEESDLPLSDTETSHAEARRQPLRELINFRRHRRRDAVDLTSTWPSALDLEESDPESQSASRHRAQRSAAPSPEERGDLNREHIQGKPNGDSNSDNNEDEDEDTSFYSPPEQQQQRPRVLLRDAASFHIPERGHLHVSRENPDLLFAWQVLDGDGFEVAGGERGGTAAGRGGDQDLLPGILFVGDAADGEGVEVRAVVGWDGVERDGRSGRRVRRRGSSQW